MTTHEIMAALHKGYGLRDNMRGMSKVDKEATLREIRKIEEEVSVAVGSEISIVAPYNKGGKRIDVV